MTNRTQSLFHGSDYRFRPEHIEPGEDGLIHLHLNPNPIRVSYRNIYHYALDRPLESLPLVVDQCQWETKGLVWELTNLHKYLTNEERAKIDKSSVRRERDVVELLFIALRDKGLAGFRYINAHEFPGMSVAIFDSGALLLPEEGFDKFYGESFENDYEEAMEGVSEDELTVSQYLTNAINNNLIGHWPVYLAELDELVWEIQKQFLRDDDEDPNDKEAIARVIAEFNNITEENALKGIAAVTEWKRLHPEVWSHEDAPFSLTSLTEEDLGNNGSRLAYEVV